ncbi:flagellin [Bacillus sp. AG4(2022)]|uniref:flagellin N-terminal helical domain-containing protein n=1 Tax=Bacillus sp. AG4(2022) TaxID=2962594 RepID=UPI0037C179BA
MEKLASGLRINKAGDDAAGLAISEKMRGQIRGLDMASKNAQDGISLISTAEGALNETHDILQRMRELSVQSSNDTNTADDRAEIQKEVSQLQKEITRIGDTTEFNTQKLLDGSKGAKTTSADLTGGVAVDVTGGINLRDGAEVKNNSFSLTISAGATKTADLSVEVKEGNYKDAVEFTVAVEQAIKDAAKAYDDANGGTAATTAVKDLKLNFEVDTDKFEADGTTPNTAFGEVTFSFSNKSTTNDFSLSGSTTAGNDVFSENLRFGTSAVSVAKTADATKPTVVPAGSSSSENSVKNLSDNFKVKLEDGIASPEKVNNELKLSMDGINLTASIAEGSYDTEAALATAVKDSIVAAVNAITQGSGEGEISTEQLEAKGFRGSSALDDYKASLTTADLKVAFNDEGKLTISNSAEMKIDETSNAANTLGLTNVNADIKNSGISLQIGANSGQAMKIDISDMRSEAIGSTKFNGVEKFVSDINVSTEEGAQQATDILDKAISQVSAERSKLGAFQNRLEHTINNLGTSSENLTAAESRIRDVDYALAA